MVTIADVARAAGVSVATVSRVLNESGNVRSETVEQVRGAVERLHYVPNLSARNLRRNESRVVIVVARNFTNPFYAHALSGVSDTARDAGYTVMACNNNGDPAQSEAYGRMLENHQTDGILLLNCTSEDTWIRPYASRFPVVQCCEFDPWLPAPRVVVDHAGTGLDSTNYLISQGHRRIGFMGADNAHASTKLRFIGYRNALRRAGIPLEQRLVAKADGDYSFESGERAAAALLRQDDPPTAIFCVSDILALSTILTATGMGLRVPEDLSVMGCDDVDYTTMMHPFLTTVRLPCYEFGHQGMLRLIRSIQEPQLPAEEVQLEYSLQIRESTGPRKT